MTQCIFAERLVVDVPSARHMLSSARRSPVSQEHVAVLASAGGTAVAGVTSRLLGLDGVDVLDTKSPSTETEGRCFEAEARTGRMRKPAWLKLDTPSGATRTALAACLDCVG